VCYATRKLQRIGPLFRLGLPSNESVNGRCYYESRENQAISHFYFIFPPALPRSLGVDVSYRTLPDGAGSKP